MTRTSRWLVSLPMAALLVLGITAAAFAHDTTTIVIRPNPVTAGEKVELSVTGVEPNQDRVIVLIGQGIVVPFPTVRTDANGSFTTEVMIPSRLPGGTYRFEAIGDETLTGDVDVIAAAGGIAAQPAAEQSIPESRTRSVLEAAGLVGLALLAGIVGIALILRAERFLGSSGA